MVCGRSSAYGWGCRCAFSGSAEWLVLLFLLCPSQSISLSGRKTLVREGCFRLLPLRFRMPVELVRGGMALGDAKGWDGGRVGEFSAKGWPVEDGDGIVEGDGGSAVGRPI